MRPAEEPDLPRVTPLPALHGHAIDDLRFIRENMERAGSFTALSGWGFVAIGATALAAVVVAARQASPDAWLATWLAEALVALVIGVWTTGRKAQLAGTPMFTGPGQRFAFSFALPAIAAGMLTLALHHGPLAVRLPGVWLLLYGVAIATGGAFSVRSVPVMGLCFMAVGTAALLGPAAWAAPAMAFGFGGLHIGFGVVIARRHGG
jgi:hypothetical protein